ncbi:5-bromo-4-chloroindolyl phosphate hydrolysis family protein [Yoonia sp. 2307UL14-13]|uniref:5-bromo-4-chloroindolyl phosphate hydrolysis family protein n=1 Tax=Yoonia sp. 2307UL14-13 TaxID=3126506 RepID=UPI0030994BDE
MAQRFGGKFSPGARDAAVPVPRSSLAPNLLFLPPIVLVFASLGAGPQALVLGLIGGAVLTLGAWLLREGIKAEAAYDARKVARRPALPRKILAAALTGLGAAIAAFTGDTGVVGSVLYGIAASGLHVAAFGIDPMVDKQMEGIDTRQQDRVARVVDEAETYLDVIAGQIDTLGDRQLKRRAADFQGIAQKMIRTVEEDPRDLTAARKFLGVYLMGARDATVKFVDLYRRQKDDDARTKYLALLDDLEQNFASKTDKMLLDDRSDMDIEINVLRDRLQREGVRLNERGTE